MFLGFRVAPVLETYGFVCDCSLSGEQPRDCSHPMARVSPSILVTKWKEAHYPLIATDEFRWVAVIDYLHPSAAAAHGVTYEEFVKF